MRRIDCIILLLSFLSVANSQIVQRYSIEECRQMASEQNKQSQIQQENIEAAKALKGAALAKMFPKVNANGAYMWNEKNISLLAEDALLPVAGKGANGEFTITNMNQIGNTWVTLPDGRTAPVDANGVPFNPAVNPEKIQFSNYAYLPKEAMEFDIENIFVAQIGVTQPIFLGGKLIQLYKIAKANEQIAQIENGSTNEKLLVEVDEAYWRVVSVENKLKLAKEYAALLDKLEQDVSESVEEGVATKADLLKVKVKKNEAQMSLQKAEDGLVLSKMALAQVCGLPLDSQFELEDDDLDAVELSQNEINMNDVWDKRKELQLLEQANNIAKSGVKIAASGLMPNIVAQANYVVSNPNMFNGFDTSFKGMFNVGVVVNVPIAHADDILQLKAAKHKAKVIELQMQEAREKIELQATQSNQQVAVANKKLIQAKSNIESAEENLRMAEASFDEGLITATELMGAQTAWLQANSEKIDAAIDVKLYQLYLQKNTGNL